MSHASRFSFLSPHPLPLSDAAERRHQAGVMSRVLLPIWVPALCWHLPIQLLLGTWGEGKVEVKKSSLARAPSEKGF